MAYSLGVDPPLAEAISVRPVARFLFASLHELDGAHGRLHSSVRVWYCDDPPAAAPPNTARLLPRNPMPGHSNPVPDGAPGGVGSFARFDHPLVGLNRSTVCR